MSNKYFEKMNPFILLEQIVSTIGRAKEYADIYARMKDVVGLVDQWDDTVREGLLFVINSEIVKIPAAIEDFIKIICNSEKTSMTEILRLMEESEKQGGTGFEKLFRVTKSISDLEKAKILLATPFVKTKKELDTTPKIVEAGNIANSIYKIARDFIF